MDPMLAMHKLLATNHIPFLIHVIPLPIATCIARLIFSHSLDVLAFDQITIRSAPSNSPRWPPDAATKTRVSHSTMLHPESSGLVPALSLASQMSKIANVKPTFSYHFRGQSRFYPYHLKLLKQSPLQICGLRP